VWLRHEDWLKTEEYISKLPRDLIIYDEIVKKVYADGVEFHGGSGKEGAEEVRQALRNLALVKMTPELVGVLERMSDRIEGLKPVLPAWRRACVELDRTGDPRKCLGAWKNLDLFDKNMFLDYWMENYESVGVRR